MNANIPGWHHHGINDELYNSRAFKDGHAGHDAWSADDKREWEQKDGREGVRRAVKADAEKKLKAKVTAERAKENPKSDAWFIE